MRGRGPTSRAKWLGGFAAVTVGASLGWSMAELAASLGSQRKPPVEILPRENRPPERFPLPRALVEPACPHPVVEGEPRLRAVEIAKGFASPVHIASPAKDFRLFILEERGRIRIVEDGKLRSQPFFELPEPRTPTASRATPAYRFGTLAFHPRHHRNGRLFVSYVDSERKLSRILELHVGDDPNRVVVETSFPLLELPLPSLDQEAATLAFGPDGHLYVALGDGGIRRDPHLFAQRTDTLLGKILRLDIDRTSAVAPYALPDGNLQGPRVLGEIWALGVRRPSGLAFDRATGELWLVDRGERHFDEIDVVRASETGVNFGWSFFEGSFCVGRAPCSAEGLTPPLFEMTRSDRCSLVGGRVYRGCRMPALDGEYFFADRCGRIRSLQWTEGHAPVAKERIQTTPPVSIRAFGEDASGELYVIGDEGGLYRIEPE